jgi:hypothetical protein
MENIVKVIKIEAHAQDQEFEEESKKNWYNGKTHQYTLWADKYNNSLRNGL